MPESLQTRLAYLRHRLRQMTWLYGLSWLAAVLFGATLAAGLLDWTFRIDDPGVRLILGLGILAAAGWIGWRLLLRPLRRQISDVEIALRIENRYPGFNDSLASTVQFLAAGSDPRLGSPEMQKQVVERTVHQVERVNLSDLVETRRVRKVALSAVGICLLAALLVGLDQAAAGTALHRLVFPFANRPWPKTTELQLVDESLKPLEYDPAEPLRLARGDTLEIYVKNRKGRLPQDVRMQYKFGDEEQVIAETLRRTNVRDADGQSSEVGVASLVALKGPMEFRAVGGDDQEMPWHRLEVVPPPAVESLQVTLTPPAYSGQSEETLPSGVGHIRGLVGTKVHLTATTNKPLQSAKLRVKDQPPLRVPLSNNGRQLEVDFEISEAGVYSWWFDLEDLQGFENANAQRYEVRGIADIVPDVWIDEPPRDDNVTPTAMVPLKVGAKDDLGLRDMRLQYKVGNDPEAPFSTIPLFDGEDRPEQHTVEYEWQLAELDLQPGQVLTFHAEARDDFDLDGEHIGRSITRKLTIVSPEEKQSELASRQGGLVDELQAAFQLQAQTHDQVEQLKIQLAKAGELRLEDIDLLKRLEIEQRQINARLSDPKEGLTARIDEFLRELKQNKIDDSEMEQRLQGIGAEIGILQEDHLPLIEQELTNARKLAQTRQGLTPEQGPEENPDSPRPKKTKAKNEQTAIERAEHNQQAVLDSLDEMLAQLAEWKHHQDLAVELRDLIGNQEAINQATGEVGRQTFGKSQRDLTPQEQADLARLADRQRKQAERINNLNKSFEDIAEELKKTSPQAAEIVNDAREHLKQEAIAGNLRETANQLNRNQIGEASREQQRALEDLNELSDILQNRSVSDTETLVKKLKDTRDELEQLRKRQEELHKKAGEAEQISDPEEREKELERLRQEQQQIRREASSMARRLRRLQARQSGNSLRRSAGRMEQAEKLLQEDQPQQAEDEQQEVLEDLEQAERELAQELKQAEEQLAREMLERIGDKLKSMIGRQQTVIEETNRLEALRRERGNWSRAQLKSLRDLAEVQRNLKAETEGLVEIVQAAEVFALALKGAAREMELAAGRLDDRQTDGETIARETAAKNRFVDLIAALDTDQNDNEQAEGNEGGGGADSQAGPQTDGVPHIAQLKMLKTLQEDLIRRTEELDRLRAETGDLTDDQALERDLLAGEQGQLADLTRNLTAQFAEAFQADPAERDSDLPEQPAEPEEKPEAPPEPPQKPSLEDQLDRDLDLENLIPESKAEDNPGEDTSQLHPSRKGFESGELALLAYPVQRESKQPGSDEETKAEEDQAPPKKAGRLDEDLFRELGGSDAGAVDPSQNPLEEAVTGMRSAQERITQNDTGEDTRKIQEEVVANLQKLIDMMNDQQSKPPSPPDSPPPPQDQQQEPQDGDPPPQPQDQQQQADGNMDEQPQTAQQESDNPEESTEEQRQGREGKSNLRPRPESENDVWGHLPPSIRQKLLSLSSDKYLPKYEDLARRYFEALAEPAHQQDMKTPE